MVATSEKFKELFNNVKKDETDEETSKILVAAYEREEGLESVPTRSLRALIKSLKEKAFSFLDDNTLSPSYVLKKWLEPEQGPSEEDEPDKTPNQAPEKESDHNDSQDSEAHRRKKTSKKRKAKRSPHQSARTKSKKSKRQGSNSSNLLDPLRDAAGVESLSDSGSNSDASSFTKERRKKRRARQASPSSDSDSDSSTSSSSSGSSGGDHDHHQATLRPVPKKNRQMRLLCDKKESKNLYGGFIARAMNITAYVATLKFKSMRNKREAETLGRTIDFIVDQYGKKAIVHMDACEVLLRRFTAVLHADSSTWEFATNFEECPEGPFVGVKMYSRVKKMARLAGVRAPAMKMSQPQSDPWRQPHEFSRNNSEPWRHNQDRRKEERDYNKKSNRRLQGTRVQAPSRPTADEE